MKRFGLIGHPIAHSLSPALFKAGYDGKYPYELIQGDDFEDSYHRFVEGYDGINVTAPFKELAYAKADILSDDCKLVKATNLLVKTPEGVKAYNSDLLGVRMWLKEVLSVASSDARPGRVFAEANTERRKGSPAERSEDGMPLGAVGKADWGLTYPTILIVGCGGAGKAAAAAAVTLGLKVVLMNRNPERAASLAEDLTQMGFDAEAKPMDDFRTCFREADVIIYNIPAAIPELDTLTDEDFTPGKPKFIFEANYKDPSFKEDLLTKMMQANTLASYTGGRTWLLYQAWTGYEIFTGEKPDLERMSDVL